MALSLQVSQHKKHEQVGEVLSRNSWLVALKLSHWVVLWHKLCCVSFFPPSLFAAQGVGGRRALDVGIQAELLVLHLVLEGRTCGLQHMGSKAQPQHRPKCCSPSAQFNSSFGSPTGFWFSCVTCYFLQYQHFWNAEELPKLQTRTQVDAGCRGRGCDVQEGEGSCVCSRLEDASSFTVVISCDLVLTRL